MIYDHSGKIRAVLKQSYIYRKYNVVFGVYNSQHIEGTNPITPTAFKKYTNIPIFWWTRPTDGVLACLFVRVCVCVHMCVSILSIR